MIGWQKIETYENVSGNTVSIDNEPEILLYNERTGVTTGKALKWPDGEILVIAVGYHNFTWTHFAHINKPKD